MTRHLAIAVALVVTALPSAAFACAMAVPHEKERMLSEIMDDIDAPTDVNVAAIVDVPGAIATNAAQDTQPALADHDDVVADEEAH